jgi:3-oxoacyl-[acyl-carrier protein] reductase
LKVAIITGGGTGIGAATAKALAARGVSIVINHLGENDHADAQATAAECQTRGVQAVVIQADVGEDEQCRRLIDTAAREMGRIDYLVNNAGYSHGRPLTDIDAVEVSEFEKAYAVNSTGPFLLSRYAAPHMRAAGGGAIVNIASMAGLIGMGSSHGYCASKAALINLSRSLARVLSPEIRVNAICPGLVDTPHPRRVMGDRFEELVKLAERQNFLGGILQPEDIAVPAVFLLMDAGQITGEVIRVDGGGHLGGRM